MPESVYARGLVLSRRMDGVAAVERDPIHGFRGTPEEIERQWYEQVYRGRGDQYVV